MGWYGERALPRLVDLCCGLGAMTPLREAACADLAGDVIELGFGSGLNVPHYPEHVGSVAAIEPADKAWRLAEPRVAASPVPIERAGLDGQRIDAPDSSYDAALSTFTLCTIPDAPAALAEVRRVLKPGGRLHFVEHGLAPDTRVQRWQRRLQPPQTLLAGGCQLGRQIDDLLVEAGFELVRIERFYGSGPKPYSYFYLGSASSR